MPIIKTVSKNTLNEKIKYFEAEHCNLILNDFIKLKF